MTKVTIIKEGAKINYSPISNGSVVDIPDDLVGPWVDSGLCIFGEIPPNVYPKGHPDLKPEEIEPGMSVSSVIPKKPKAVEK